jgi:excisionase family DNA binding protein
MAEVVRLPRLLTERQAAAECGVSTDTLRRERRRGRIGFTKVGGRVRYTDQHLSDYLKANEVAPCQGSEPTSSAGSGSGGSAAARTAPSGAARGSTPRPDRHAAHRLALRILRPPGSPSRNGSR